MRTGVNLGSLVSDTAGAPSFERKSGGNIPARYTKIVFAGILLVISAKLIVQSFRL